MRNDDNKLVSNNDVTPGVVVQRLTWTMLPLKYQATLLVMAVMFAHQTLALSQNILSSPRQLQVKTEPSRAAIIISRTVKGSTEDASAPASGSTADAADNTTKTTAMPKEAQETKMTGKIEVAFTGIRELNANGSEVYNCQFNN